MRDEAVKALSDLAARINGQQETIDLEKEKARAIAQCKERIKRAQQEFIELRMSEEDWKTVRDANQHEIARWQRRTDSITELYLQLEKCAIAVKTFSALWQSDKDAERQDMIRNLFEEIVINLDTQRIETFKLKVWAEEFLTLRATLYAVEDEKSQSENGTGSGFQDHDMDVPPRGFEPRFWP